MLTAIGGTTTRKLEVFDGIQWDDSQIPEVGNAGGSLTYFTSLVIQNNLYVIGKNYLKNNSKGKHHNFRGWS